MLPFIERRALEEEPLSDWGVEKVSSDRGQLPPWPASGSHLAPFILHTSSLLTSSIAVPPHPHPLYEATFPSGFPMFVEFVVHDKNPM